MRGSIATLPLVTGLDYMPQHLTRSLIRVTDLRGIVCEKDGQVGGAVLQDTLRAQRHFYFVNSGV